MLVTDRADELSDARVAKVVLVFSMSVVEVSESEQYLLHEYLEMKCFIDVVEEPTEGVCLLISANDKVDDNVRYGGGALDL